MEGESSTLKYLLIIQNYMEDIGTISTISTIYKWTCLRKLHVNIVFSLMPFFIHLCTFNFFITKGLFQTLQTPNTYFNLI